MMEMLHITDLHKQFGDKTVLKGLHLSVPEHSIYGFIGKNGAGKTTTMKAVLGLLKADAGTITVNGEAVTCGQTATNRYIGYLPDVPEFYPYMTAEEYLRYCGAITKMDQEECERRCRELLELVGLSHETHRIKGYSRGMKQRLGIAQALLNRPKLLICDEPTSALDPVGRKEILDILSAVKEQTTVLFSTHILSDVERICTDVALLDNGVVAVEGKLAAIKARYRREEYLLETDEQGAAALQQAFPALTPCEAQKFRCNERELDPYTVFRFITDRRIPLMKWERIEPTLESLFMEVTGQ